MSVSPTIKMMAGKIGTFSFCPAIEMIRIIGGHHHDTSSVLTSAAGNSPHPVTQGEDGNFPLLSPSNSEEILTPIQEEARCEGRSAPIRLIPPSLFSPQSDIYGTALSSLRLSSPRSQASTARPCQDNHSPLISFSDYFIQVPSF